MKSRLAVLAVALVTMAVFGLSSAEAQVRVGFGIHVNVPFPHRGYIEVIGEPPFSGAIWVRGCWVWNAYEGRNIWVPGHWVARRHHPFYRRPEFRHVPRGIARGWGRSHDRMYRGHGY